MSDEINLILLAVKTAWCVLLTLMLIPSQETVIIATAAYSEITFFMVWTNLIAIFITILFFALIYQIKPLRWSWFCLFSTGKDGEPHKGANIHIIPATVPVFGIFFMGLLALHLFEFALIEEVWFRNGTNDWWTALRWSFYFGIIHCLVGVPIAAGIALTIPGLWFNYQYMYGDLLNSTLHHMTYNTILISMMMIGAIIGLIVSIGKFFGKLETA